jgi:cell division protein FtsB
MQSQSQSIILKALVLPKLPQVSLRWILVVGIFLIGFLLISYIIQVNQLTKASFSVASYEKNLVALTQENKDLEMNFSQLNSLVNLESLLKDLNYVEVNKIHYIQILEETMVAK